MRRDLSRLSPLSNLFIHHPYSQSSKASNPRLPRWRADREADRRAGCKSVHKMFNTPSMTTRFTFTKFQKCYQHEDAKQWVISASRICDSYKKVEMHQLENGAESATCPILQMLWNKLGLGRYFIFGLNHQIFFGLFFPLFWIKYNSIFAISVPPEKLDFISLKMCWSSQFFHVFSLWKLRFRESWKW